MEDALTHIHQELIHLVHLSGIETPLIRAGYQS